MAHRDLGRQLGSYLGTLRVCAQLSELVRYEDCMQQVPARCSTWAGEGLGMLVATLNRLIISMDKSMPEEGIIFPLPSDLAASTLSSRLGQLLHITCLLNMPYMSSAQVDALAGDLVQLLQQQAQKKVDRQTKRGAEPEPQDCKPLKLTSLLQLLHQLGGQINTTLAVQPQHHSLQLGNIDAA